MKITGSDALPSDDIAFLQDLADQRKPLPVIVEQHIRREPTCVQNDAAVKRRLGPYGSKPAELVVALAKENCTSLVGVGGLGPRNAVKQVKLALADGQSDRNWAEKTRVMALLGSCPKSHKSFISGFRCWCSFAANVLGLTGAELPPTVDGVVAWSVLFRCTGTFRNYVGHLRLGCQLARAPTNALDDRAISRATSAIAKRGNFVPRPKQFVKADLLRRILVETELPRCSWSKEAAMMFLTAYVFLLRVPSECLPIVKFSGRPQVGAVLGQSSIWLEGERIYLRLKCRKNKPRGSELWRSCWCSSCCMTCPIHVLGRYFSTLPDGSAPFVATSPGAALGLLRNMLDTLGVADAAHYRTHDLRRGHSEDLKLSGATLLEILRAGEWRSGIFKLPRFERLGKRCGRGRSCG